MLCFIYLRNILIKNYWVKKFEQWNKLTLAEKERFAPICPEFVVELRSKNDALNYLKDKMKMWIENGVHLAWLIDPQNKQSFVYRKDGSIEIIDGFDKKLSGETTLSEFELDLSEILD